MYKYITIKQLIAIKEYQTYGYSIRKIATKVNCSKSTVHRTMKQVAVGLIPIEIFSQIESNQRKAGRKLIELTKTEIDIVNYLVKIERYSPDIISHILRKIEPSNISTKTLYNMFKANRHDWNKNMLLRKGKNKSHKKTENRGTIKGNKSIHERNILFPDIKKTQVFGHLEGDTLVGKDHKSSIITLADIWSKTSIPLCTKSRKSSDVTENIINYILKFPKDTIKTITFDCGKEFSKWIWIEEICDVKIYFADPGRPGQRGLNKNNNSLLRRDLPKSTDLSKYSQDDLDKIALKINSMPRKILNYKSSIDLIQLF